MKDILFLGHLGMGDLLISNALVRHISLKRKVRVLVRPQNAESARFMWRDNLSIDLLTLTGDFETQELRAKDFAKYAQKLGKEVLVVGIFGPKPFEIDKWDSEIYRQGGLDFKTNRWNGFRVDRQESREFAAPKGRYIFVHDDPARGFKIEPSKLPKKAKIVRPEPKPGLQGGDPCIFDWWGVIENADEIHVIDSAFLCLIDSLPHLKAKRIVFHAYARPQGRPPSTVKDWERFT